MPPSCAGRFDRQKGDLGACMPCARKECKTPVTGYPADEATDRSCDHRPRARFILRLRLTRVPSDSRGGTYPWWFPAAKLVLPEKEHSSILQCWIGAPDLPSEWAGIGLTSLKRKRRAFENIYRSMPFACASGLLQATSPASLSFAFSTAIDLAL